MRDLWVVALGDSFASGQGVPDVEAAVFTRRKAQWIDGKFCASQKRVVVYPFACFLSWICGGLLCKRREYDRLVP